MRITSPAVACRIAAVFLAAGASSLFAAVPLTIKPLVEKRVTALPAGELYWTVEKFPTATGAQDSPGATTLEAAAEGSWWRFTLGAKGISSENKVAEVGPVPRLEAKEFLLRINLASGVPGSSTPIHSHPGSEAFYVLNGEQRIHSTRGELVLHAGQSQPGFGANLPMQVSSSGAGDLRALVMFVVDATQPFSSPSCFPAAEAGDSK